jgi:hypothetical protein
MMIKKTVEIESERTTTQKPDDGEEEEEEKCEGRVLFIGNRPGFSSTGKQGTRIASDHKRRSIDAPSTWRHFLERAM